MNEGGAADTMTAETRGLLGFAAAYAEMARRRNGTEAEWWSLLRSSAFDRFTRLGFPTRKDEAWKYTPVRELAALQFALPGPDRGEPLDGRWDAVRSAGDLELLFVNGVYRGRRGDAELPEGVWCGPLGEAPADVQSLARKELTRQPMEEKDVFAALTGSVAETGTSSLNGNDAEAQHA